jgi:hypothetical protein
LIKRNCCLQRKGLLKRLPRRLRRLLLRRSRTINLRRMRLERTKRKRDGNGHHLPKVVTNGRSTEEVGIEVVTEVVVVEDLMEVEGTPDLMVEVEEDTTAVAAEGTPDRMEGVGMVEEDTTAVAAEDTLDRMEGVEGITAVGEEDITAVSVGVTNVS